MSEWISIASPSLSPSSGQEAIQRRKEIVSAIAQGLIKARAFRSRNRITHFKKDLDLEVFCLAATTEPLDAIGWPFETQFKDCSNPDWSGVEGFRLVGLPMLTTTGWVRRKRTDMVILDHRSDWQLGHFQSRMLSYPDTLYGEGDDVGFMLFEYDAFSVEVEAEATERLLGKIVSTKSNANERPTMYDWEAAFADVAARFYHETEFENLHARGVQSEIIDLLRESFERRQLPVPSHDTLKPKARKILGALRDKKP